VSLTTGLLGRRVALVDCGCPPAAAVSADGHGLVLRPRHPDGTQGVLEAATYHRAPDGRALFGHCEITIAAGDRCRAAGCRAAD
jgi:hypothetical protein